jgi:hypothetical protein
MSRSDIPGESGIAAIVFGVLVTAVLMSVVTQSHGHWLPMLLGIGVGLLAVRSINK